MINLNVHLLFCFHLNCKKTHDSPGLFINDKTIIVQYQMCLLICPEQYHLSSWPGPSWCPQKYESLGRLCFTLRQHQVLRLDPRSVDSIIIQRASSECTYAIGLGITFGNQPCFVPAHRSICIVLDFIHPFAPDCLLVLGKNNNSQVTFASKVTISSSMAWSKSESCHHVCEKHKYRTEHTKVQANHLNLHGMKATNL